MKNLLYLFLIGILFSCGGAGEEELNPEEPDINSEPKEYIVSLGMTGEIEISESPLLGRASSNDLYGINVYYSATPYSETSNTNYKPYAQGLFDNNNISIKLLEGYHYKFESTMVVDGKKRCPYYETSYPFGCKLLNQFIYGDDYMPGLYHGHSAILLESGECRHFFVPNTDRYYGEISGYKPIEEGKVSINMKRVVFGVKFIAEGLTEGRLKICIKDAPELYIKYGETEVEDIFTFQNSNSTSTLGWTQDSYTETIPVSIYWEKADGAIVPLVSQDVTFKRKTLTTITIKVKDSSVNNGVEISQEGGDLIAGDNITIESGTGVENPVEPNI